MRSLLKVVYSVSGWMGGVLFWVLVVWLISLRPEPNYTATAQQIRCCVKWEEWFEQQPNRPRFRFICGGSWYECAFCRGWEAKTRKTTDPCRPDEQEYRHCDRYYGIVVSAGSADCSDSVPGNGVPWCFGSFPERTDYCIDCRLLRYFHCEISQT